jgi:hypothetical protein
LVVAVSVLAGIVQGVATPSAGALPDTSSPGLQLARVIHTTPFAGSTTSMRDNEGSAYVAADDALWLADDNANRAYEVDRATGALRRVITGAEFEAAPRYGGGSPAGPDRTGDLESVAYDSAADVLYIFSAGCCDASALPTAFRLTRGGDNAFHVESHQPLASSAVTAAAVNPGDGNLYVGAAASIRRYTYTTNTLGAAIGVSGLSGILGLGFSSDGADLFAVTSAERLYRIDWATRTIVPGWNFDLTPFAIGDSRGVELINDQFFVADGDDARPAGDPLKNAVFVFDIVAGSTDTSPPNTSIDSGPSGLTNSPSATFTFSSSEAGSTFECRLDAAAFTACTTPREYSGLTETSHTFEVRAIDAAGNVDSTPAARTWSIDATPPSVTTVSPAALAIDVPLNGYVQAAFSEAVDPASVTGAAFSLVRTIDGAPVAATLHTAPTQATLDPVANLAPLTEYTARVSTAVRDLAGNQLAADRVWSFVTAATPPPPGPGIRRETTSTVANPTPTSTVRVSAPSGTVAGDVLVACLSLNGGDVATAGAPSGWVPITAASTSSTRTLGYYKVAGSSEPGTYAWSLNSSVKNSAGIARYSGVDGVVSRDAASTNASGSGARVGTVPGVTTTTPNAMIIGCMAIRTSKTTITIASPAGMAQAWDIGGNRQELADAIQVNPGSSGSKTWSFSKSQSWAGWLTALRPR